MPSESSEFGSKAGHPNWWNPGRGARNRVCSESRLNYKTAIDRSRGDQRLLKILVANRKGGCGKTTVATQLASALAVSGHAVCLADADRQRSSLGWLACRPPEAPPITALDWTKEIGKPPKGEGFLVIDAVAGLHGKRAVEMVKLADLLILPMLPFRRLTKASRAAFLIASRKCDASLADGYGSASSAIGYAAARTVPAALSDLSRGSGLQSSRECATANSTSNPPRPGSAFSMLAAGGGALCGPTGTRCWPLSSRMLLDCEGCFALYVDLPAPQEERSGARLQQRVHAK